MHPCGGDAGDEDFQSGARGVCYRPRVDRERAVGVGDGVVEAGGAGGGDGMAAGGAGGGGRRVEGDRRVEISFIVAVDEARIGGGERRVGRAIEPALVVGGDEQGRGGDGERAVDQGEGVVGQQVAGAGEDGGDGVAAGVA